MLLDALVTKESSWTGYKIDVVMSRTNIMPIPKIIPDMKHPFDSLM